MRRLLAILFVLIFVAACGSTDTPTDTTDNNDTTAPTQETIGGEPTPTREGDADLTVPTEEGVQGDPGQGFGFENTFEGGFRVNVNGTVVDGDGTYTCVDDFYVIEVADEISPQVTVRIRANLQPGVLDVKSDDIFATVNTNVGIAPMDSGVLVLNNLAVGADQQVRGSFDFVGMRLNEEISVVGEFDFTSSADSTYCS